jgi:hypothetical protein
MRGIHVIRVSKSRESIFRNWSHQVFLETVANNNSENQNKPKLMLRDCAGKKSIGSGYYITS